MKETLYSIPVSEVFEPRKGCPICCLHSLLEQRAVDYIMGAAMMEPAVRIRTNELGFCYSHLEQMHAKSNSLSLALILESRLIEIGREMEQNKYGAKNPPGKTCFVCEKIDTELSGMIKSLYLLYNTQEDFRKLFAEQEFLCHRHYLTLRDGAKKHISKKLHKEFCDVSFSLASHPLEELKKDIRHYCNMFDYRNADADWGNSRGSIERAVAWTTSTEIDENK